MPDDLESALADHLEQQYGNPHQRDKDQVSGSIRVLPPNRKPSRKITIFSFDRQHYIVFRPAESPF